MSKTVLVVAAHSDDEALGCVGTIAKHIAAGDQVHVLFMTDGVVSRNGVKSDFNDRELLLKKQRKFLELPQCII
ncbi:MAG: LmbE family N-acetylglucosaminyl deacetylase [Colwellia sp.]|jgi:LmbE family N-acetylglucosaminyl deacetylase